ncbi:hypothetical protein J2X32_004210, partial [Rheinheimera pacifica]|uniref:phosphopantetheine-binding protein n=1 Tax=Rheinheimera pacifica TaxID=173990 RepID=UPI002856014F
LPDYMVPSHWVSLSVFPLTANGKVDRKALPAVEVQAGEYEAPQGETEQALAQLWQQLLGVEQVSRYANFFMLGGHSLLVTRLSYRIREHFGIEVALPRLLKAAELQDQARLITELVVLSHNKSLAAEAIEVEEMSW